MDGITGSPTLGGVVLAALAAAGYAVFKVSPSRSNLIRDKLIFVIVIPR